MKPSLDKLKVGDGHYKAYVGPPDRYDFMGATQFRLLTSLGLRAKHKMLDYGCGSLRSGKLLIPYLEPGNYFGQDPNQWLIDEGISEELGDDIVRLKKPNFSNRDDFEVGFDEKFDYIIAQSIFSHTDLELTRKGLSSIANSLAENGLALVTMVEGENYTGDESWVYPGCTTYEGHTIADLMNDTKCHWRRLWWYHPGQTWFVLSKNEKRLPSTLDSFLLLGGEEVGSCSFKRQHFVTNRIFSFVKSKLILSKLVNYILSR